MGNMQLKVAGVIFLIVAIMHLMRLIFRVKVTVANSVVPLWFSAIGFVIPLALSLWMFKSAK